MTDVRLTATTPEGEVVPALANTKGELLLEAPIAPPEFDGNLDGDLTVSGSAEFGGTATADKFVGDGSGLTNLPSASVTSVIKSIQQVDFSFEHGGGSTKDFMINPVDVSKSFVSPQGWVSTPNLAMGLRIYLYGDRISVFYPNMGAAQQTIVACSIIEYV